MDSILAAQMGLTQGDRFSLGLQEFILTGFVLREPDSATGGFALAPRTIVRTADLAESGLLAPGTLYDSAYRLDLPDGADLAALEKAIFAAFPESGLRWRDSRRAAPGVEAFVERIGAFLILVGLAGLAVGGVGVASAVRAYLEAKIATIATLRTLGADGALIFRAYLLQIAVLVALGVAMGLGLGVGVPLLLSGAIEAALPFPAQMALYPRWLKRRFMVWCRRSCLRCGRWPKPNASARRRFIVAAAPGNGRARGMCWLRLRWPRCWWPERCGSRALQSWLWGLQAAWQVR
jgi:putative ABC transport system permease protein